MKIEKLKLFTLGVPDRNGRIYSKESFSNLPAQVLGALGQTSGTEGLVNMCEVSQKISDIEIVGDSVYGQCTILDTPNGQMLKKMVISGKPFDHQFTTLYRGTGIVAVDNTVTNFTLLAIDLAPKT